MFLFNNNNNNINKNKTPKEGFQLFWRLSTVLLEFHIT